MKEKFEWREARNMVIYVMVICSLTFCIIHYVGQRTIVDGSSMEPSLSNGDNLIVDKITYRNHEPKRFDVIVFPSREAEGEFYIKRIIGLPGETVHIDAEGAIFIDGEKLAESYGREVIKEAGLAAAELKLGADEYFVLGDNRNDSLDSRDSRVGMIKREEIIGKAWFRIFPADRAGRI